MNTKRLNWIFLLLTMSAWTVSAQLPSAPAARGNQFAIELFTVKTPEPFNQTSLQKYSKSVDQLFTGTTHEVHAFPALYADKGTTVVNDQTEEMMLAESYNVINGEPVPVETLHHIGVRTRVTIKENDRDNVTFHIDFHHQTILGNDTYKLGNGTEVDIPYFETRKVNTELTLTLGSWVVLGGIESKTNDETQTTYYVIRISHPRN